MKTDFRNDVQALADKLDVILPIVDGYIAFSHVRSGSQYTGPNLIAELAAVKKHLALASASASPNRKTALTSEARQQLADGDFGEPSSKAYQWIDTLVSELESASASASPSLKSAAIAAQCLTHGSFDPRCETCPHCLQAKSLERLAASASPQPHGEGELQELVNDLWQLFTSTPTEIAATFSEARCVDDEHRINYALELMSEHVTLPAASASLDISDQSALPASLDETQQP